MKFLDSDIPRITINQPQEEKIYLRENSFTISGNLYNEYLPAHTVLNARILDEKGENELSRAQIPIQPSDLWQPKGTGSPVAEFNAKLNLPGQGRFLLSLCAVNPAGISSPEILRKITLNSGAPILEYFQPQGESDDLQPLIFARVRSQEGSIIDNGSLSMKLDGITLNCQTHADPSDPCLISMSFTPETALATGKHEVNILARDNAGGCLNEKREFKIVDLNNPGLEAPEGYFWGKIPFSQAISYATLWYEPLTLWDVTTENFQEKLVEVKETALSAGAKDGNENNVMGLYINWGGKDDYRDGPGQADFIGCTDRQELNFSLTPETESIPVYTLIIFGSSSQGPGLSFVKNVLVTIDSQFSLLLDKEYQQTLFYRPDSSHPLRNINALLPYYGNSVHAAYSFDPRIYTLEDNADTANWPHIFRVYDRTHLKFSICLYGWRKQKN